MGFLAVLPFAVLAGFVIGRVAMWLRRPVFGGEWRRAYWLIVAGGGALGIWCAWLSQYDIAGKHLEGFPIPFEVLTRENPSSPWVKSDMPPYVRAGVKATDVLCMVAVCLLPLAIAAFVKENKGQFSIEPPRQS